MLECVAGSDFNPAAYPDAEDIAFLGLPFGKWGIFKGDSGLWALQQCRREWAGAGLETAWEKLSSDAANSSCNSVVDLAGDSLFAPPKMTEAIAVLCRQSGQQLPVSPADYVRVICRSLAALLKKNIGKLATFTGYSFKRLYIIGGGVRNTFLCGEIGSATALEIITGPAEASAAGNILMQAAALGDISSDTEFRKIARNLFK